MPTYSYSIPIDFEMKVGQEGNLLFINAVEDGTASKVLLIYKLNEPKFSVLYDIYPLSDNTTFFSAVILNEAYFVTTTDSKTLNVFR